MDQRIDQPANRSPETGVSQTDAPTAGAVSALGEQLEEMFDAMISSPLPESLLRLVETLEAVARDARPVDEYPAFTPPAPPNQ